MRTVFFAFTLFFAGIAPALGSPLDFSYTHNTTLTVPELSEPEASFHLAKTWFLPDWQAGMGSRTDTAPAGSGDRQDLTCSTYGGCPSIPTKMNCSESFAANGMTCYKSCSCKSGYNLINSADICLGCENPCDTVTSAAAPYGCQTFWAVCPSKCQVAYPDNCRNRTAASDKGYGCEKYFSDCASKCEKVYTDNCRNLTAASDKGYGCEKYFDDCSSKCEKAYDDNCRIRPDNTTEYGCEKKWNDCPSKCETGKTCIKNDCSSFPFTTIPANANYSSCSAGCGENTLFYKVTSCKTGYLLKNNLCLSDSCPHGFTKSSCAEGYIESGRQITEYGSVCYSCRICRAPDAAAGWISADSPINTPNVSLIPTGATGSGEGTCALASYYFRETTTDECNRQYKRICHHIYLYNGWQASTGPRACNVGQNLLSQGDGCGNYYDCCQDGQCVSYLPIQNTFKSASMWQKADYNGNIQQEATSYCSNRYINATPIIAQENCGNIYFACLFQILDRVNGNKAYVSCDTVRSMNYDVYSSYSGSEIPCLNGIDNLPYEPTGPFTADGYVPIMTTVTTSPSISTGT